MLDGFEVFDFSEGVAYVSITSNGVTFNKAVTMKLHYPEWVLLLINPITCEIAIQPCSEDTPNRAAFFKEKENGVLSVRWNSRDLLNRLEDLMYWDLEVNSYRVAGTLLREDNVMKFDLKSATPMQ